MAFIAVLAVIVLVVISHWEPGPAVPPTVRYTNACAETTLYDHAVGRGEVFNVESQDFVEVMDTASHFEGMHEYWVQRNKVFPNQVYVGEMRLMDGVTVTLPDNSTLKSGQGMYGLYFLVDITLQVSPTEFKGPMLVVYQCHYD